jgi:hypothetical protein
MSIEYSLTQRCENFENVTFKLKQQEAKKMINIMSAIIAFLTISKIIVRDTDDAFGIRMFRASVAVIIL